MQHAYLTEPLPLTLLDGAERKFRLTLGALNRAASLCGVPLGDNIMQKAADFRVISAVLYESCVERGKLSYDTFQDLLPLNPEGLIQFFSDLAKASGLFASKADPTGASEAVQASTGADSGPLPELN